MLPDPLLGQREQHPSLRLPSRAPTGGARAAAKSSRVTPAVPKATRSIRQVTDHLLKTDKKASNVASSKVPIPRVATETAVPADAEREPIKVTVTRKG
jgi:hypothetical protein